MVFKGISRSKRRIKVKMPSGEIKIFYKKKRPGNARCAECRKELHGMFSGKSASKTERRPERPYGGVLCSICLRKKIIDGAARQGI